VNLTVLERSARRSPKTALLRLPCCTRCCTEDADTSPPVITFITGVLEPGVGKIARRSGRGPRRGHRGHRSPSWDSVLQHRTLKTNGAFGLCAFDELDECCNQQERRSQRDDDERPLRGPHLFLHLRSDGPVTLGSAALDDIGADPRPE
jgi:hypothetical protein